MKCMASAALSTLLLAGCGAGAKAPQTPQPPTKQHFTEAVNPNTESGQKSNAGKIIYRERLYNTDSYTKSDLIIEDSGRVWCGFYMHNEGTIDRFDRLWTSDEEYSDFYELDDDRWLKSVLSESSDDDFMLFGDIFELGSIEGEDLSKLDTLVKESDPFCTISVHTEPDDSEVPEKLEKEYDFIDLIVDGEIFRVYEYTQSHTLTAKDDNASAAVEYVHSCAFYQDWRSKCTELLVPYGS